MNSDSSSSGGGGGGGDICGGGGCSAWQRHSFTDHSRHQCWNNLSYSHINQHCHMTFFPT